MHSSGPLFAANDDECRDTWLLKARGTSSRKRQEERAGATAKGCEMLTSGPDAAQPMLFQTHSLTEDHG